ncbi:uncharacterized protein LOC133178790 [Saccostrea echinata]|uniref:uncharacterized protein LOC133178790 n=1 Tax=Saccostrea echinata TaxID=191078 RepID=UPI002A82CB81|nr:uncharacterized protein LOC133178790 [Saccostrea echinata]
MDEYENPEACKFKQIMIPAVEYTPLNESQSPMYEIFIIYSKKIKDVVRESPNLPLLSKKINNENCMTTDIRNEKKSRNRKRRIENFRGSAFQKALNLQKKDESEPKKKIIKKQKYAGKIRKKRYTKIKGNTYFHPDQQEKNVNKDGKRPSPTDTLGRPPTDEELVLISGYIGNNFLLLGVLLGLENIKIQQIIMSFHASGVQTQIFQMLATWKMAKGRQASVKKLLDAIEVFKDVDFEEIKRVFKL